MLKNEPLFTILHYLLTTNHFFRRTSTHFLDPITPLIWSGESSVAHIEVFGGTWIDDINYAPDKMFDGDLASLWHSKTAGSDEKPCSITVTFIEPVKILAIKITSRNVNIHQHQETYQDLCIFLDGVIAPSACTPSDRSTGLSEIITIIPADINIVSKEVLIQFAEGQHGKAAELRIHYEKPGNHKK